MLLPVSPGRCPSFHCAPSLFPVQMLPSFWVISVSTSASLSTVCLPGPLPPPFHARVLPPTPRLVPWPLSHYLRSASSHSIKDPGLQSTPSSSSLPLVSRCPKFFNPTGTYLHLAAPRPVCIPTSLPNHLSQGSIILLTPLFIFLTLLPSPHCHHSISSFPW